jgi:hypothetical protein
MATAIVLSPADLVPAAAPPRVLVWAHAHPRDVDVLERASTLDEAARAETSREVLERVFHLDNCGEPAAQRAALCDESALLAADTIMRPPLAEVRPGCAGGAFWPE